VESSGAPSAASMRCRGRRERMPRMLLRTQSLVLSRRYKNQKIRAPEKTAYFGLHSRDSFDFHTAALKVLRQTRHGHQLICTGQRRHSPANDSHPSRYQDTILNIIRSGSSLAKHPGSRCHKHKRRWVNKVRGLEDTCFLLVSKRFDVVGRKIRASFVRTIECQRFTRLQQCLRAERFRRSFE